jgi:hypothetical protein
MSKKQKKTIWGRISIRAHLNNAEMGFERKVRGLEWPV